MCVLKEIQYSNYQYLSLKISIYLMREEETTFLYLLVAYNQTSNAIKYLKKMSLLKTQNSKISWHSMNLRETSKRDRGQSIEMKNIFTKDIWITEDHHQYTSPMYPGKADNK